MQYELKVHILSLLHAIRFDVWFIVSVPRNISVSAVGRIWAYCLSSQIMLHLCLSCSAIEWNWSNSFYQILCWVWKSYSRVIRIILWKRLDLSSCRCSILLQVCVGDNCSFVMCDHHQLRPSASSGAGEIEHVHHLSGDIGALYMKDDYSDITLKIENERFYAHKVILAARSEYFR